MQKEHRWLKSAVAASAEAQVAMPWQRGSRSRPEAMKSAPPPVDQARKSAAVAAR